MTIKEIERLPLYIWKVKKYPWVRSGKVMMGQLFSEHEGKIILIKSSSN